MDNKKMTRKAHNNIAKKYYELYKDDTSDLEYFDTFLKQSGPSILDLGCGMGHYSSYMYKQGFNVVGIDFSKKMLSIAKKNNPNIEFILDDVTNLKSIENRKFDGIVLAYVLQHLSKNEVISVFNTLNKYVYDNTTLLLFLREGEKVLEEIEPINPKFKYIINEYSKEEIKTILENYGWEIIFMETKDYIEDPNSLAPTTLVVIAKKV